MESNTFNEDAGPALTFDTEAPVAATTPLEKAALSIVEYVATAGPGELPLELANLAEHLGVTASRSMRARIDTPRLLEVTGNVEERELAARHMDHKARAALFHAKRDAKHASDYEHVAECFRAAASDFRSGLHLPEVVIEGKVIPYNQDNDTGIKHATALTAFFTDVYARNLKAGWWTDIESGAPKKRNVGELFILFVTEIAEAYLAWRDRAPDDKLGQYPGLGVELADLGIRWADFCGAALAGNIVEGPTAWNPGDEIFRKIVDLALEYEAIRKTPAAVGNPEQAGFLPPMDVAEMTDAKLAFNAHRPDHKLENRLKADGKKT